MRQSLIKVWAIFKIELHLLNHIRKEICYSNKTIVKSENSSGQWTHLHNTRLRWLEAIASYKLSLITALNQSSKAKLEIGIIFRLKDCKKYFLTLV